MPKTWSRRRSCGRTSGSTSSRIARRSGAGCTASRPTARTTSCGPRPDGAASPGAEGDEAAPTCCRRRRRARPAGGRRPTSGAACRRPWSEMSDRERSAFTLRHFEGWSIAEIAGALGLDESATKQSIFRAVRKARAVLAPAGGGVAVSHLHEDDLTCTTTARTAARPRPTWRSARRARRRTRRSRPTWTRSRTKLSAGTGRGVRSEMWNRIEQRSAAASPSSLGSLGRRAGGGGLAGARVLAGPPIELRRQLRWRRCRSRSANASCWWRWAITSSGRRWSCSKW